MSDQERIKAIEALKVPAIAAIEDASPPETRIIVILGTPTQGNTDTHCTYITNVKADDAATICTQLARVMRGGRDLPGDHLN